MDISDYTRIVLEKIQKYEPENATKIVGYLLLHDLGEHELADLGSCPDHTIREIVYNAKTDLQNLAAKCAILSSIPPVSPQPGLSHSPIISLRTSSPPSIQVHPTGYWDRPSANNINPEFMSVGYIDSIPEHQKLSHLFCTENHIDHSNSAGIANGYFRLGNMKLNLNGKSGRRYRVSEFPVKTCQYFNKGYCRHGSSCRYYHGQVSPPESFSQMNGNGGDDEGVLPGSLVQLEAELVELLKSKRGGPISIAALPMLYFEKFNRVLQADGYLTERQRHGKSGYSLTNLLSRMKNSIRVIVKPHGQHFVVLAEDRLLEKGDYGQYISASRQLYMTFPAESSFTDQDVSDYFNSFGQVEDVRIPPQQRRMFGFVTFSDPETVKMILKKGNRHCVRGAFVIVKPYREKSRKYSERVGRPVVYPPLVVDFTPMSRYGKPRFLKRHFMDEHEHVPGLQRRQQHLPEVQLPPKHLPSWPHFGSSFEQFNVSDHLNSRSVNYISYAVNDHTSHTDTNWAVIDMCEEIDLPESPFSGNSAVSDSQGYILQ